MHKYLPDPYLLAIILSFVVFVGGLILTGSNAMEMINYWGNGFWSLLTFTMQMVLVLVTGHALANAPIVKRGLTMVASIPKNPVQAVMLNIFVAAIASWINWGFGLVVGAILGREIAKQVKDVDYKLLIAAGFTGMVVWHGGISGSIPLALATESDWSWAITGGITVGETIFAPYNLAIAIFLILTLPFMVRLMVPKKEDAYVVDPEVLKSQEASAEDFVPQTPADKLENSWLISMLLAVGALAYLIYYFAAGGSLNLNIVNFIFLFAGIALHWTPRRYLTALYEAVKTAGGIVLQFPFYAGIMGMMNGSGLTALISDWFIAISSASTLPVFAFLSGGLVNIFVPSGGGQWAVQGPIMLQAAQGLGADMAKTAMGVAWGDAWTNLIQPFWALPALAIAGLKARDIMGYCTVALFYVGIIVVLGLLLL